MNERNSSAGFVTRKTLFVSLAMVSTFCLLLVITFAVLYGYSPVSNQSHLSSGDFVNPSDDNALTALALSDEAFSDSQCVAADAYGVMFMLRNIDGKVAVLNSLETSILEILEIKVSSLPEQAQKELEAGYCITSVSELVDVLMSYSS